MAANPDAQRLAELAALVDAVKERVRTQYPDTAANASSGAVHVAVPDLTPVVRARDAAAGKMAAIGTVNPRQGGLLNSLVQTVKRAIARGLNWFVRDQVIFNRQMVAYAETCIETLNDINRTIQALAGQANTEIQRVRAETEPLRREAEILRTKTSEFQDLVSHWNRWREQWQLKLHQNEVAFLKSVADLNTLFHQRSAQVEAAMARQTTALNEHYQQQTALLDAAFRKTAIELEAACQDTAARLEKTFCDALAGESRQSSIAMNQQLVKQARDFERLLAASITDLQNKFYGDLERIRTEYERVIHAELRVVRQRLAPGAILPATTGPAEAASGLPFDYVRFADRFRGSEEYVSESQRFYLPYFAGRRRVLDIGCGRGEFLQLMQEAGVPAKGIEASDESVEHCRSLDLESEKADLFVYLSAQAEASLDGIFCSQVVEHLPPDRLAELIRLCATRLATGGVLAIETPNPECLAIFATHFYLDPTHTRPVPSQLLAFYMEESGLGRVEIHPKAPAVESMPEVGELPGGFREKFFGGLDYAIIGYRL